MLLSLLSRWKRGLVRRGHEFLKNLRSSAANPRAAKRGALFAANWPLSSTIGEPKESNLESDESNSKNPLWVYFKAHKTGPGIWKWPHYFPVYHRHLVHLRGAATQIVEIGIYSGGSLGMWIDYFGPTCRVHGVDIEEACKVYASDQVSVHVGDQASPEFWERFCSHVPSLDVVIDDGGHQPEQQMVTLEKLLPKLSSGGVYICEDVHGFPHAFISFVTGLIHELNRFAPPNASPFQQAIHSLHFYPYAVVIEKNHLPREILQSTKNGTQWQPFFEHPSE
jgi:hypothetical protein